MRVIKSQPKLKISLNKYDNFFAQKNFEDPMYMDEKQHQQSDQTNRLLSYSSMSIQPRAKLSYSLHDKVGAVLSDSRKMGMIEKVQNLSTRKSLAKLSYVSTLPPIKTQTQQTQQHLRKVKNQLNDVSLKSIKMSKEVSNIQASINQTKQKSRVLTQILSRTGKKQQDQIDQKKQVTQQIRYNFQVRTHIRQNLKSDIRVLAKCKHYLSQKFKTLDVQLNTLKIEVDNIMTNLNNNIYTKKQFENKQQLTSEDVMMKAQAAQNKLTHEHNAQKIHQKLTNLQKYEQSQYKYETNLANHQSTLKQLRIQQVLYKMMNSLHNKYQTHWQQFEKAYSLIKMYTVLNSQNNNNKLMRNQSNISVNLTNKSLVKNSSMISVKQTEQQLDIAFAYNNSFKTKKQLQEQVKKKQQRIKQLETKKQGLTKKYIQKVFEDSITQGNKVNAKKVNYQKQVKKLMQRQERAQQNKTVSLQVQVWLKRHQQKLNLQFSKKLNSAERIIKIIQYMGNQVQQNYKPIKQQKKQIKPKKQQIKKSKK